MLRLSLSCGYYDRTLPILTGAVQPDGIALELPPIRPGTGMGSPDADAYELPLPAMIIRRARENSHLALPIFLKRTFFHQLILVREDSPLHGFADLGGRNVGLLNWYQHALGVWLRGHLQDDFGVAPHEMRWFTQRPTMYPLPDSSPVEITILPPERSQVQMLLDRELDVLIHEQAHQFLQQFPGLRRLFLDFQEQETAYFRATGCFPINHVLCIRREIVEANPWVATSLVEAFEAAKGMVLEAMERNNTIVSTPWMDVLLEAQRARLGPDPYPYGLEANRSQVERLVRYLHTQQLIPRALALDEIFAG